MSTLKCNNRLFVQVTLIAAILVLAAVGIEAKTTRVTFENGMDVIFKENHSSSMITSIVFVRAGAKYENDFNNGITHFLEHLLFDGTKNRSRLEITEGIEKHGGYINAFTRKDLTAFLVLMPAEYIEFGLEIQADQLFNSIFPEEELAKERKVVIEEIQQSDDNEADLAYRFFNAQSMAGTAYERPVLGYPNIIASLSREKIIDYWRRYYAPNNMIALVIGDFDTEEMIETYRSVFGVVPPANLPSPPEISYYPPAEKKTIYKAGKTKMTYIAMSIDAPHFTDPDYYAFDLMAEYLNSGENSPLSTVLTDENGQRLYQSLSVSLETAEEFSRLVIDITTDDPGKAEPMIAGIEQVMGNFEDYQPSADVLRGIQVTKKADEIFMAEKLHYYGFIIAPMLVTTGWDFLESYLGAIEKINPTMMVRAAQRWLEEPAYTATVFYPKKEVPAEEAEAVHTVYRREVLPNGLTLVVKSNPDSRVFALNVIGKNRSAAEPAGKEGITDFVNRMIQKGTTTYNAVELAGRLAAIGAQVTLYDNPWIPFDDRYTTRQFSFMKFETIDEYTEAGLALFADMIINPAFDSAEVETVRKSIMGLIGRQSGSTLDMCRNLFYRTLFDSQAYSRTINGSPRTVGMITKDDLAAYHRGFYSPGNMIITVGTNYDADEMMGMLRETFIDMPSVDFSPPPASAGIIPAGVKTAHEEMDKEQVYIFLGSTVPGAAHPDVAAIKLAAEVLSSRLKKHLREEQGLAYSVGAGATFDRDFGWYTCTMGTGAANFSTARDGIIEEMRILGENGPTADELETAKNSLWGSSLTRQLSRINQAFYMGVNEYLGLGYDYEKRYLPQMRGVTVDQVKAAAAEYFNPDSCVIATVGKL